MKASLLRDFVRLILESEKEDDKEEKNDDLLLEPDYPNEEKEEAKEASTVGAAGAAMAPSGQIRGVTTPLGTGPTYPKKPKSVKKKKNNAPSGVRAFGGASLD